MNEFKKDRNYFLRYCIQVIFFFTIVNVILYNSLGLSFNFTISTTEYLWPIATIIFCGLPASVLHNCAHKTFKYAWVNLFIGEICGTIMLYGFKGFAFAHLLHHIHPDDPKLDPHPSRGLTFFSYSFTQVKTSVDVFVNSYYFYFGRNKTTEKNIFMQLTLFKVTLVLRIFFWLILLGPKYFILLYLPINIANTLVFAHLNYATHIEKEDGSSEIINLNNTLYHKFANIVTFGSYFHKSHHVNPSAFNPSKVKLKNNSSYISYIPSKQ